MTQKFDHLFNILSSDQFERCDIDYLCALATKIRGIAKSKSGLLFLKSLLPHKRAMLYFTQPSTRTFLSFQTACQILGMNVANVRDPETSSELKGETPVDSLRTFSSYFDLLIIRSKEKDFPRFMANLFSSSGRRVPIINAGSGSDEHPTQALLDIYTLHRSFEHLTGLSDKTIIFVGDLKRGRTVRSLSKLLTKYNNIFQCFVAPPQLQISEDIIKYLGESSYILSDNLDKCIGIADAIYMTRIQSEWDIDGESDKIDVSKFCFKKYHLDMIRPTTIIMHPLPRRTEIDTDVDFDKRAMYWRQVRNGMWIRVALISAMFAVDNDILAYNIE